MNGERTSSGLTPRQHEVIARLRSGLSNKEIAAGLGISEDGVKAHLSRLYLSYGVTNRVALLRRLDDDGAVVALDRRTLGELRTMRGDAHERSRRLGADRKRASDGLATIRDALAAVDVALDLVRDLPAETSGPVLDAVRKRVAKAMSTLDSLSGDRGHPDTLGRGA